jgi:hypothetical protein
MHRDWPFKKRSKCHHGSHQKEQFNLKFSNNQGVQTSDGWFGANLRTRRLDSLRVVDTGVCITQESDSKLLAIIRAAHALLAAGDAEAARDLLASFSSPGVDALC